MPFKDPAARAEYKRRYRREHGHKYYEATHRDYKETAFIAPRREWTQAEDDAVLAHEIPDMELVTKINRSLGAIHIRRHRLLAAIEAREEGADRG